MDANNLRTGEKIAGAAGLALFIIMFIGWWGAPEVSVDLGSDLGTVTAGGGESANAWQAADFLDLVWALTAITGVALALIALSQTRTNLPVALSALVTGLGILSVLTIVYRLIDTPLDATRKIGVFLGLLAAAAVAYGGWKAMEEEGTSFGDQSERLQGRRGAAPPPSGPAA